MHPCGDPGRVVCCAVGARRHTFRGPPSLTPALPPLPCLLPTPSAGPSPRAPITLHSSPLRWPFPNTSPLTRFRPLPSCIPGPRSHGIQGPCLPRHGPCMVPARVSWYPPGQGRPRSVVIMGEGAWRGAGVLQQCAARCGAVVCGGRWASLSAPTDRCSRARVVLKESGLCGPASCTREPAKPQCIINWVQCANSRRYCFSRLSS